MPARLKRALVISAGWGLIALGILGIILPILPGIPFALAGLLVLSGHYVWAHDLIRKLRLHFPKTVRTVERYSARFSGVTGD